MKRVYLDHAAATPMLPEARAAMTRAWAEWANPSSPHAEGRAAKRSLEDARQRIAAALGWRHHLIFTSGASEAAEIAWGGHDRHGMRSATEHDAIVRAAPKALELSVDDLGRAKLDGVPRGVTIAIQSVNSETGVVQPEDDTAQVVVAQGGIRLADCSQSAGKLPLPQADLIILSAHKLGGPPGIGALLVRDLALLTPGGGQEGGYRAGTENLPAALGFAAALEARPDRSHLRSLRARLDHVIASNGGLVVADRACRLDEIASYRLPGVTAASQLIQMDLAGIAVSAGSACSSGSLRASRTLAAMGWSPEAAGEVIRVSVAASTTDDDIDRFLEAWLRLARQAPAA